MRVFRGIPARADVPIALTIGNFDGVHLGHRAMIARLTGVARRHGLPYVLSPRGMLASGAMRHHAARKRLAYQLIERRHLSSAALLHATSPAEALSIERRVAGVPVAILPNGVDAPPAACARGAFRRAHGLPDEAPLIAFLGRVHPIKRLDLLAAAFDRIRAARPGARLVIAGPDGESHRRRLEPLFRAAGDLVRWTGEVGDREKWTLLADAQALVLCSDSESFGMSVVEALAAGVPVVVTRTCPWAEVETAGCGFWVPQDADAIARGVLDLLADPISARIMGERGRGLVRARYTWDAVARAMIERYEAVAGAWPGRSSTARTARCSARAAPEGRRRSSRRAAGRAGFPR